jgi:hypothetical protein
MLVDLNQAAAIMGLVVVVFRADHPHIKSIWMVQRNIIFLTLGLR